MAFLSRLDLNQYVGTVTTVYTVVVYSSYIPHMVHGHNCTIVSIKNKDPPKQDFTLTIVTIAHMKPLKCEEVAQNKHLKTSQCDCDRTENIKAWQLKTRFP